MSDLPLEFDGLFVNQYVGVLSRIFKNQPQLSTNITRDVKLLIEFFAKKNDEQNDFMRQLSYLQNVRKRFINFCKQELSISTPVMHIIEVLIQNQKIALLPKICKCFLKKLDDMLGTVKVYAIIADEINEKEKESLTKYLKTVLKTEVICVFSFQKDLIAGSKIVCGSRVVDFSMQSVLTRLSEHLKG